MRALSAATAALRERQGWLNLMLRLAPTSCFRHAPTNARAGHHDWSQSTASADFRNNFATEGTSKPRAPAALLAVRRCAATAALSTREHAGNDRREVGERLAAARLGGDHGVTAGQQRRHCLSLHLR